MPFKKGEGGRKEGAVNKSSKEIREFITNFLHANLKDIQDNFDSLKPVEKMRFITDILPFVAPKLQSTTIDGDIELTGTLTFKGIQVIQPIASNGKEVHSLSNG